LFIWTDKTVPPMSDLRTAKSTYAHVWQRINSVQPFGITVTCHLHSFLIQGFSLRLQRKVNTTKK